MKSEETTESSQSSDTKQIRAKDKNHRMGQRNAFYDHSFDKNRGHGRRKMGNSKNYLYSFSQYKPGQISIPIRTGVSNALSRLNYEFSDAEDAGNSNSKIKSVASFKKSNANKMSFVGNVPVGENIPVGSARNILIAATWRTGSTFLGDLLNTFPGSFYFFEPLHYYSSIEHRPADLMNETNFLKSLYSCQFDSGNIGYLHHIAKKKNRYLLSHYNPRLWRSCERILPEDILCLLPEYLNTICPLYPIRLVKTVRMRVSSLEDLIKDSSLHLQVIVLVRDPRGVYNSRRSGPVASWCSSDECSNPTVSCADLVKDLSAAFNLERAYPGTVHLVRYEDLSMEPEVTARRILKFLNLPWTEAMAAYIQTHTYGEKTTYWKNNKARKVPRKENPYGTSRNSSATAFAWMKSLGLGDILNIQAECSQAMQTLGYRLINQENELKLISNPVERTAVDIWPNNVH